MPISFKQILTATQQVSITPSTLKGLSGSSALPLIIQLKICVSPKKKHLIPATKMAIIINADHILLKAIFYFLFGVFSFLLSAFLLRKIIGLNKEYNF